MDIDQIYFSNLKKFDGKKTRRLRILSANYGSGGGFKNNSK